MKILHYIHTSIHHEKDTSLVHYNSSSKHLGHNLDGKLGFQRWDTDCTIKFPELYSRPINSLIITVLKYLTEH